MAALPDEVLRLADLPSGAVQVAAALNDVTPLELPPDARKELAADSDPCCADHTEPVSHEAVFCALAGAQVGGEVAAAEKLLTARDGTATDGVPTPETLLAVSQSPVAYFWICAPPAVRAKLVSGDGSSVFHDEAHVWHLSIIRNALSNRWGTPVALAAHVTACVAHHGPSILRLRSPSHTPHSRAARPRSCAVA